MTHHRLPLFAMCVLLTACGLSAGSGETTTTGLPAVTSLDMLVAMALADAAERLGVPESDISVKLAEAFTWSDGSIGCLEPGYGYTQALVDGHRIILEHDGIDMSYHQANGEDPFLCEDRS